MIQSQSQFLRLSPLGLALGGAAAALVAILVRLAAGGFGYGYGMMRGTYGTGPYGHAGGMMGGGWGAGFGWLALLGAVVFAGILGAIVAVTYNAIVKPGSSSGSSAS